MLKSEVPVGWKKIKLRDILTECKERNNDNHVKNVLSVTNSLGFVDQKDYFDRKVHSEDVTKYKIIKRNQFAYNPSRVNVGSIDYLNEFEEGILSPMYIIFKIDETKVIPDYFKYFFETKTFLENVKNNTQGSVRDSLSFDALKNFNYIYPSIEKQREIVSLLKKMDNLIAMCEKLYAQNIILKNKLDRELLKKGYNNSFVKSKIGFINKKWDIIKAGEMFENINIKNKSNEAVLAVTQDKGVVLRDECGVDIKYSKEGLKNYKYVEKNDFIISLRSFQGGIEFSNMRGIVSPAYTILKNKEEIVYDFYRHYFKSLDFLKDLNYVVEGLRDGKQISYSKFKEIYIVKPPLEEQHVISNLLNIQEKICKMYKTKYEHYKNLKKGLMQQLLTGKVDINV